MRIRLNKIKLEYFKGLKSFEADFQGNNALIRAENGVGKTTVYDGFLWALFGKDSDGRTDFSVRPLDSESNPIPKVVVAVEAEIEVNGTVHTLRKEQHEHITKAGKVSYPKEYLIDGEPGILEKNYKAFIEDRIPEDKFKMFTDLSYFCDKLHWTGRRGLLIDLAGNIPNPAGFNVLLEKMNGKKVKAYEKILNERKKALEKDRDEIGPGIKELQRLLDDYAQSQGDSYPELIAKREDCQQKVDGLTDKRDELVKTQTERQKKTERINQLTVQQLHRASIVKQQQGPVDKLLDERTELEKAHADRTRELVELQGLISQANSAIDSAQNQIDQSLLTLKSIKEEYSKADSPNCSLCGQVWPADKPKPGLADIEERGKRVKEAIDSAKIRKGELQDQLNKLVAAEQEKVEELKQAEEVKNARIAEINETITNRPEADPAEDTEWKKLTAEIEKLQAELGEPASKQLENIEAQKKTAEEELHGYNKSLEQFDTNKKTEARIKELEQQEKDLSQKIADVENELDEIARYKMAESKMVEASVNGKFKHVTWKLFKPNLNGSIDDTCEAMYDGTPYADMSAGEKIFCGIDVINTLSDYYGVEAPLFIDHAESMTMPIEAESQVIRLYAQKGVKELLVEVEQNPDEVSWEKRGAVA